MGSQWNLKHKLQKSEQCRQSSDVVVITPPLPRDGGTARTAIQVHAVNLIEIRLGERLEPIAHLPTRRTVTGGCPRVAFYDMLGEQLHNCNPVKYG